MLLSIEKQDIYVNCVYQMWVYIICTFYTYTHHLRVGVSLFFHFRIEIEFILCILESVHGNRLVGSHKINI